MRFAFFTLEAYDMLTGGFQGKAGGAKLQQSLIGRELADRGHDIFFVEYDDGTKSQSEVEGIDIILVDRPSGSEFRRGITALNETRRVINQIEPDLCFRRVLDFQVVLLSAICRYSNRRFVYGIAHDEELGPNPRKFAEGFKATKLYRWLNDWALANADGIIAQNQHQYHLARKLIGNDAAHLIPNCCPAEAYTMEKKDTDTLTVLWVGRIKSIKQPGTLLELAPLFPDVDFTMIGGPNNPELFDDIQEQTRTIQNVSFEGYVPHAEIEQYYNRADVLLNTSKEEGFPNTFLEAWGHQVPVVSLNANPNGILTNHKIGFCAEGSIERLQEQLTEILDDNNLREQMGEKARKYVRENHSVEKIVDRYEEVFLG